MYLKKEIVEKLNKHYIYKFVVFCDNVLNYHGDEDCYYEEWWDDIKDDRGWVCLVNTFDHVSSEMSKYRLHYYINYGPLFNDMNWRTQKPAYLVDILERTINTQQKQLL